MAESYGKNDFLRNCQVFPKVIVPFVFTPIMYEFQFFKIPAITWYDQSLFFAILVGVQWYIMVLACISLMANNVKHLSFTVYI